MTLQLTNYTIPLAIILLFLILGASYVYINRKGPQDIIGIVVLALSAIWISSLILEYGSTDYMYKILFNKIQYTGSMLLPVGIFFLTVQYTRFKKLVRMRNILLISAFPVIMFFMVLTNEYHKLVWTDSKIVVFNSFSIIVKTYNTLYFIYTFYLYALIAAGIILVIYDMVRSFRSQGIKILYKNLLLTLYISAPLLIIVAKTYGINPFPALEESPIIIAIGTLFVISILNRTKIREIMPMALNTIFENMGDGLILLDEKDRVIKMNPASQDIFDTTIDEVTGKPIDLLIPPDTDNILGKNGNGTRTDSRQHYYNSKKSDVKNYRGKHLGKIIVLRDITRMKKAEEDIKYLSFHDKLTGLYNRAFFDSEVERLDTKRQLPISIVIGDVNGLKIINDAFGHKYGDMLLTKIANILKRCFRDEDIIARWGGDEFCIILPGTSFNKTNKIINRINSECEKISTDILPLSISLGAATKSNPSRKIAEVIKEAEDRMYRHKLIENQSTRSSVVTSLKKALRERDYETDEHVKRMEKYAMTFGKILKLTDSELDNLNLLATLHDIGKIATPDDIILKPKKLTKKEWKVMKKHSEIGYRIALSTTQLTPVAEAILYHHERWDGKGYPYGISKYKIPLIARMISIIDTYDAITSNRPYRKAASMESAIKEIKKCSGSQFDPKLVDIFIALICELDLEAESYDDISHKLQLSGSSSAV